MRTLQSYLLPGAILAVIVYFCYHALTGEQGLASWTHLQGKEGRLEAELARLEAERDLKNHKLDRLRDGSLDLDYLEEVARTKLSYARPDEILVSTR